MATTQRGQQYTLYAYVCGGACVKRSDVDGTVSFMQVFMKRPSECRYAVVGMWDVATHGEVILVWDLFETMQKQRSGKLVAPQPLMVCDDVDQAIMATLILFDMDRASA